MDTCIMRNYGNYIPQEHLRFDHAVLLLHQHKDDLFLNVMDKYLRYSAHVTVLVSCKKGRNSTFYRNNLHAQYFSSRLRESVQFIPSARVYIEKHYTAMYRPSITVTDDLDSEIYLPKYCPQYYNYASNHFCQLNVSSNIQGLNLAHPIDLSRFDHQLSLFTCNYLRHKICIKTIIQILPPCFVFFTAFGDYKQNYRFQEVINAFILFKHKYDKYLGHEIMLILGGEYFQTGSDQCKRRRYLRSSLENVKKDHNVIFLKKTLNQSEKKTLLRLSYAAVYLDDCPDFDEIKFTMSLGTPIICSNTGYAANMVVHGVSGFRVDPERIDHIAACMETLSLPTVYHRFSTATRNVYLKNYSEMSMFLQTVSVKEIPDFNTPEMAINPALFCNSAVNSEFPPPINSFDLQNDWYVNNECFDDDNHPSVFEDGAARIEYENHIEFCKQQLPQQKQFYVNSNTGFTFDCTLPRWSEEDEVCDQMYGDHLFEIETADEVSIKDPALHEEVKNENEVNPRQVNLNAGYELNQFLQPYKPPAIETVEQSPPSEPFEHNAFVSYQPPPIEPRPAPVPILVEPLQSQRIEPQPLPFVTNKSPFIGLYKVPGIEQQPLPFGQNQPRFVGLYKLPGNEQQPSQVESNQHPFAGLYKSGIEQQSSLSEPNKLPPSEPYPVTLFKPFEPPPVEGFQPPLFKQPNQLPIGEMYQLPRTELQPSPFKLYQTPFVDLFHSPRVEQRSSPLPIQSRMERQPSPFKTNQFTFPEMYQPARIETQPPHFNSNQSSHLEPFKSPYNEPQFPPFARQPSPLKTIQSPPVNLFQNSCIEPPPLSLNPNRTSICEPCQPPRVERQPSPFTQNLVPFKESFETPRIERLSPFKPIQFPMCQSPFSYFSSKQPNNTVPVESYQPPPFKTYQSPFDQLYEPPSIESLRASPARTLQTTSSEPHQILPDLLIESKMSQPYPKENKQPVFNQSGLPQVNHVMQQNQPIEQHQNQPIKPFENQQIEQHQNELIPQLQNQQMRQLPNQEILQRINQPLQQFGNEHMQHFQNENNQQLPNKPMQQFAIVSMQQLQNQRMEQLNQSLQQLLNQPMQQHQGASMQQHQGSPMQQHQGSPMRQNQASPMQQHQGSPMQQHQGSPMLQQGSPMQQVPTSLMQQLQTKQMLQLQNQQLRQLPIQALQHVQSQPWQQLKNQPMEQLQNKPVQQFQDQTLQQFQNQPTQHLQYQQMQKTLNQPMPQLQTLQQRIDQAIEQHQKEVMQSYQSTQLQSNQDLSFFQTMQPNNEMQQHQNHQLQKVINQPIEPLQQRMDYAIQMQRKEVIQHNQSQQVHSNSPMQLHPYQVLQPYQNMQPVSEKVFQSFPPMIQLNQSQQSFQSVHSFPNQPIQPSQILPNARIQSPQTLPNQSIQPTHVLPNQTILQPQVFLNQSTPPHQILTNQSTQSLQILPNQPTQPPHILSNQPSQTLPILSHQPTQPPQILPHQSTQSPQVLPNQSSQQLQFLSNQPFMMLNQSVQTPQTIPNQLIQPPQAQTIRSPQILPNQPLQPSQVTPNQPIQPPQPILNLPVQPQGMPNSPNQSSQPIPNQLIQSPQTMLNQPIQVMSNQPIQVMPKQPLQVIPNQPLQVMPNQPLQVMPNQPLQAMPNQSLQAMPNQPLQALPNQPLQAMPNQQTIRPFYVGIMKQYPSQTMPMQNYARPQFIAPNQPGVWIPITSVPPPILDPQSSGSEYSTPRQFSEPEGAQTVECEDSDANDVYEEPTQRWEEVFANDSLDDFSAHDSELSETREDAWSGICSDDSPSSGNKSWRVFNSSYRSNSQYSDDIWQEANPDSGEEVHGGENGIPHQDNQEINTSENVEKPTVGQNNECRECRDEQCIKELHAKVNAKLENNQGIDTTFQKRSKSARRKAKKRRMKKIHPELSD